MNEFIIGVDAVYTITVYLLAAFYIGKIIDPIFIKMFGTKEVLVAPPKKRGGG